MRRTLSKLRPILQNPQRKSGPEDFYIELVEPHRTFNPGDTVCGNVVVVVAKPMDDIGISCMIQGSIRIRSNLVKSKNTKENLFQENCILWGEGELDAERLNTSSPESIAEDQSATADASAASAASANSNASTTAGPNDVNTGADPSQSSGSNNPSNGYRAVIKPSIIRRKIGLTDTSKSGNEAATRSARNNSEQAYADGNTNGQMIGQSHSSYRKYNSFMRRYRTGHEPAITTSIRSSSSPNSSRDGTRNLNRAETRLSDNKGLSAGADGDLEQVRENNDNNTNNTNKNRLEPGEHVFGFEFELPRRGLYNSLEFERGSISYVITALCHHCHRLVGTSKRALSVVCPIDVATLAAPRPAVLTANVHKKKKDKGAVTVHVDISRKGYLRGETVPVRVVVKHVKPMRSLRGVIVTLSRISIVCVEGSEPQSFRKDLSQTISPLYTDPVTYESTVSTSLRVPMEIFPTTVGCRMVSFQYCVEVVVDLAGRWDSTDEALDVSHTFVDTDRLKGGRGVVTLWTELVIGSWRSQEHSSGTVNNQTPVSANNASNPNISNSTNTNISTFNGGGNNNGLSTPVQPQAPAQAYLHHAGLAMTMPSGSGTSPALSNTGGLYNTLTHSSLSSNGSSVNVVMPGGTTSRSAATPADGTNLMYVPSPEYSQEASSEKDRLRQMEQALFPSEPAIEADDNQYSAEMDPYVPRYESHSHSLVTDHTLFDLRGPAAPLPTQSLPRGPSGQSTSVTPLAPSLPLTMTCAERELPDKLELERLRLAEMESAPVIEEQDVPTYEPSAPPQVTDSPSSL